MSERPTHEPIRSLTDRVSATKAVIASTDDGNNDRRRNTNGIENLVEDNVKTSFSQCQAKQFFTWFLFQ